MLTYVRQTGEPHETREDALDTLASALSISNIHFGFVDSQHRAILFADCGEYTQGLSKDQMLVNGAVGKYFDRRSIDKPVLMIAVKNASVMCRASIMELQLQHSQCLLFAHEHPNDPSLCVLYVPTHTQIGGNIQQPRDFDFQRVCREPSKKEI